MNPHINAVNTAMPNSSDVFMPCQKRAVNYVAWEGEFMNVL